MLQNFDFHMHSTLSYDSQSSLRDMVLAAQARNLLEICFTEHWDDIVGDDKHPEHFSIDAYAAAHRELEPSITVRRGIEVGLLSDNQKSVQAAVRQYPFDYVIGSVHCVGNEDLYFPNFWKDKSVQEAEQLYLEYTLACVQKHTEYDVLGHLTYISKAPFHPSHTQVSLSTHKELIAEILRTLAQKGKGLEVNTSGLRVCDDYLPSMEFVRLFRDLGGEIITVGSDAHIPDHVGMHTGQAIHEIAAIFGYVCTFARRQPIFHRV